jgi:hypothetical protein
MCDRAVALFIFCVAAGYLLQAIGYLAAPWFIGALLDKDAPQ